MDILGDRKLMMWSIALILGLIPFIIGIVYLWSGRKDLKGLKEGHFVKAALIELLAIWIMIFPHEYLNEIRVSTPFGLRVVEGIVTTILRSLNLYMGGALLRVEIKGYPTLTSIYVIVMALANIVLIISIAGFILRFLEGPFQKIRLSYRKRRHAYVFPVCNEKTIAIASSVDSKRANLIFSGNPNTIEPSLMQMVFDLNGFVINDSAVDIIRSIKEKSAGIHVFLFNDEEESNLADLDSICRLDGIRAKDIKVYVELSKTPWHLYDEFLKNYNSSDEEKLVVNFVRSEENFAYNNLLKKSIFKNALIEKCGDKRIIKLLIIGMNERNLEMIKASLHLAQMPGYRIEIGIIDKDHGKAYFNHVMPEIYDCVDSEGDAIYKISYEEGVDYNSGEFDSLIIGKYSDFTFAFINTEDDINNINIALQLRAFCYRNKRMSGYDIQVSLRNMSLADNWNRELIKGFDFVGDVKDTYNFNFITMSDIERGTKAIHKVRHNEGPSWISYCNNEYSRHSVYARTLSLKYKVMVIDEFFDSNYEITNESELWRIYEHMRWNVYTRTLGIVHADDKLLDDKGKVKKEIRTIAKVHEDLKPFNSIKEKEEKDKDFLKLNSEIVKILKEI